MGIIGLDVGSSHIKAVSIKKDNNFYKLERYALLPANEISKEFYSDSMDNIESIASQLKGLLEDAYFTDNEITIVIPEDRVFSKVISIPYLEGDELKKAVEWEAEQHLPNNISENYLKYTVLDSLKDHNKPEDKAGIIEVLIVAAQRKLIDKILAIMAASKLTVAGIEPVSISIVRSLIGHTDPNPTMIVNIGQSKVDFYLAVNGNLRFVHNINFGISSIIKTVSTELDISPVHANEYVFTYGLKNDVLSGRVREIILPVVDIIIQELKKSIRYVESRSQFTFHSTEKKVRRMVLAGGGALIPDMMVHLIENLHPEIDYANPWERVDISYLKEKHVLVELGPIFAAAVGAALK